MEKSFKTVDELVFLLESRHVKTDSSTADILRREGYYPVINGYKDMFLDRKAMQTSCSDLYKSGTTFNQIYNLFLFDRSMRGAIFPFLTRAESLMKNAVVHAFCDKNREQEAYLDRANYVSERDMLVPDGFKSNKARERDRRLNDLMNRLNSKLKAHNGTKPLIKHYIQEHGMVPLWVLQSDLTFGNIEHFYQLQKRSVQNDACKTIYEITGGKRRIGAKSLLRAFTILVGFRNICAHEDRLYCANVKGFQFRDMLDALNLVLPEGEINDMHGCIELVIRRFGYGKVNPLVLDAMCADSNRTPDETSRPKGHLLDVDAGANFRKTTSETRFAE